RLHHQDLAFHFAFGRQPHNNHSSTRTMAVYHAMEPERAPKSTTRKILTSLTFWIILGTIIGVLIGEFAPDFGKDAAPMAQIFLRPIQFIVFPLVFSSLIVGIAGNNDLKQLGRLSLKSFIYFEIVTTLALIVGPPRRQLGSQPGKTGITKKGNVHGVAVVHLYVCPLDQPFDAQDVGRDDGRLGQLGAPPSARGLDPCGCRHRADPTATTSKCSS
ncbi:hypothetical protein SPRG_21529, partial [Saprolegnia parasitica CBS 223.65]